MKKSLVSMLLVLCLLLTLLAPALAEISVTPMSEVDTENFTIDWSDPLNSLIFGMYSHELTMQDDSTRTLYQYIPTTWRYAQPEVAVAVPSGEDPIAFFENTGWKDAAEKGPFAVVLMTAEDWTDQDEYVAAAYKFMNDRANVRTLKVAFYMVGYGDSANAVMKFAMTNNDTLAGVAAFGVDSFDNSLIELGKTTDTALAGVKKCDVPVPMWIGVEEKTANAEELINYWKAVDQVSDQKFSNDFADEIYFYPAYKSTTFEKTYQNIASVYVTEGLEDVCTPAFTDNLYFNFLGRVRRTYSQTIRPLQYYATTEELGYDHYTFELNGVTREYWVYVPTAVKSSGEKAPLVLMGHGGGDSGEELIQYTSWYKAAEEKGFIVVNLMGSRAGTSFAASTTWAPADVEYVLNVREAVIANYPVDLTRVYMTGHSMGSLLTHYTVFQYPELFAAACGNDAYLAFDRMVDSIGGEENYHDDVMIPFMINAGTEDQNFKEGGQCYKIMDEYIAVWCDRYGLDVNQSYNYKNGLNFGSQYLNSQGVPMFVFQWNEGKIHCMDSEDPYAIWDFLCNFSRGEDGTAYYMGVEIKLDK